MSTPFQPRNGYIHVKLHITESNVLLPDGLHKPKSGEAADADDYMEVLAVCPTTSECKPGDFILLRPDCNMMRFSAEPPTVLVAKSAVMGVFTKAEPQQN